MKVGEEVGAVRGLGADSVERTRSQCSTSKGKNQILLAVVQRGQRPTRPASSPLCSDIGRTDAEDGGAGLMGGARASSFCPSVTPPPAPIPVCVC